MPMKITCAKCGTILDNSNELVQPSQIVNELKGTCPNCGRTLASAPIEVVVTVNGKPVIAEQAEPKKKKQDKWWTKK